MPGVSPHNLAMLDDETIIRFVLYAFVALLIVGFTFTYGLLYWLKRQAPERRARVIERTRRFSDQGLQLFVRAAVWWAVLACALALLTVIVVSVLNMAR
jgi:ABC-type Fe3+ transport system permease subunit